MSTDYCVVIAFHGDFASPKMLRRDTGDPIWIDYFFDGHDIKEAIDFCGRFRQVVLVGYSRGGDVIAAVSQYRSNIVAAVLYESPAKNVPAGRFPAMLIWNDRGRRRTRAAHESNEKWKRNRETTELSGSGRHSRLIWGWPPFGHGWDQSLNPIIGEWVQARQNDRNRKVCTNLNNFEQV